MKILALIAALTLAPCSGLLAQSLATGVNYNAETPIPPSGNLNITFQHDSSHPIQNVSAYVTYPTYVATCTALGALAGYASIGLAAMNATYGGVIDLRLCTGAASWASTITVTTPNVTFLMPCATITASGQFIVAAGVRNVSVIGCSYQGASTASSTAGGTLWEYVGSGSAFQIGDPTYAANTTGFQIRDLSINVAPSGSAPSAIAFYRTQEIRADNLYLQGGDAYGAPGLVLDGTGNYSGGAFINIRMDQWYVAMLLTGHISGSVIDDYANASTFAKLHINCYNTSGSPLADTYGIEITGGDGNSFTGGDIEACDYAVYLAPAATQNTFAGLRTENDTWQMFAATGSTYNSFLGGSTIYPTEITDEGNQNSFMDAFHRSWNGYVGDWYASLLDQTVTDKQRLGIGDGNERGRVSRVQTDYGYRWTYGLSDGTAGSQGFYIQDDLNDVARFDANQYLSATANTVTNIVVNNGGNYSSATPPTLAITGGGGSGATGTATLAYSTTCGCYDVTSVTITAGGSGYTSQPTLGWTGSNQVTAPRAVAEITLAGSTNNQTAINAAGTGAVVLNGGANSGTGGVVIASGGASPTTEATIQGNGNTFFNGTLEGNGEMTWANTIEIKNVADRENDFVLWAGLTTAQKEALTYNNYAGTSEWYLVNDTTNDWALNEAASGIDSFKTYNSANSGDIYLNAQNTGGVVRVNYETGSGSSFDVYGGSSSSLYAQFAGTALIKFPGLAASSGHNCAQLDASGYLTNTGSACSTGTSGTAGGDLSGSYPNPTVAKVNSAALPASKPFVGTNSSSQVIAAPNTLGCLDGYDHLPCTVYVGTLLSESSPTNTYATVFTTAAAGLYRCSGYLYGTTASSTAYSAEQFVKVQQVGQPVGGAWLQAEAQIGTSISTDPWYSYTFNLPTSATVQTESITASGTNTGGAWSRALVIERLQ